MSTDRTGPCGSELNAVLGPDERAKLDALLDHIHEYGTTSEGVLRLAAQMCQAARSDERERCAKACEDEAQRWSGEQQNTRDFQLCAARIRASA